MRQCTPPEFSAMLPPMVQAIWLLGSGVEQAVRRCGLRNRQVAHPAFHRGGAGDGVDALDAVEPRQRQQHPVFIGQRPARKAGSRAPRHHRHVQLVAGLEHRRHLCLGFRQHDDQRFAPIGRKAVALVGRDLLWLPEQDVRRRHRTKRGDHFGLPRRARGQVRLEGGIHSESSGKIYWFYWQIIPFAALQRGRSNPAFCDLSKAKLCCAKVRARRTTARQTDVRFRPDFVALRD